MTESPKNRDVVLGRTLAKTVELNSPEHLAGAEARAAVHRAGRRKGRPEPAPFPHRGADSVPGSGVDRRPRLADGAGHPGFVTAVQSDQVRQRSSVAAWRGRAARRLFVKRNKNDAADAEAICEAMTRPTMRFVAVKSAEQQSVLMAMMGRRYDAVATKSIKPDAV
jgi:hypothetical protein